MINQFTMTEESILSMLSLFCSYSLVESLLGSLVAGNFEEDLPRVTHNTKKTGQPCILLGRNSSNIMSFYYYYK